MLGSDVGTGNRGRAARSPPGLLSQFLGGKGLQSSKAWKGKGFGPPHSVLGSSCSLNQAFLSTPCFPNNCSSFCLKHLTLLRSRLVWPVDKYFQSLQFNLVTASGAGRNHPEFFRPCHEANDTVSEISEISGKTGSSCCSFCAGEIINEDPRMVFIEYVQIGHN